jgi:hypothetical protein
MSTGDAMGLMGRGEDGRRGEVPFTNATRRSWQVATEKLVRAAIQVTTPRSDQLGLANEPRAIDGS